MIAALAAAAAHSPTTAMTGQYVSPDKTAARTHSATAATATNTSPALLTLFTPR